MQVKDPKDLFVKLLSNVRSREERAADIYQELGRDVEDPEIKESMDSLMYLREKNIETIDKCFEMIDQRPVQTSNKLQEIFIDDFRKEFNELQSPAVKTLFIAAKVKNLIHFYLGEYTTLVAMSELSGHRGVGLLIESILAQKLAFIERIRRRVRRIVER